MYTVKILHCTSKVQFSETLYIAEPISVAEALLSHSTIFTAVPYLKSSYAVGIDGAVIDPDLLIKENLELEIYLPLYQSPMVKRLQRLREQQQRATKK